MASALQWRGLWLAAAVIFVTAAPPWPRSTAQKPPNRPNTPAEAGRSVAADRERAEQRRLARSLLEEGKSHRLKGEMQEALEKLRLAEGLAREIGDPVLLADALNRLGVRYKILGDYHLAVTLYSEALDLCRQQKDSFCEAETLHNLGHCYITLGNLQAARDALQKAFEVWPTIYEKSATMTALATVDDLEGNHEAAIERFRNAFALRQQATEVDERTRQRGKAATLDRLGSAYHHAGNLEQARKAYETALGIYRDLGDTPSAAITSANLGWLYVFWQQPGAALPHFERAQTLLKGGQRPHTVANALHGMALAHRQQGDLVTATADLERAIEIIESLRQRSYSPQLRASFLARRRPIYELYIDLLMQRHKVDASQGFAAQALQAAERFKARSLLEMLNEERAALRQAADPQTLELEAEMHRQMTARDTRRLELLHRQATSDEIAKVEKEQRFLSLQYEHLKARMRARMPATAAPEPLSPRQLQSLLDDDTLLLVYSLGADRSFLWQVSRKQIAAHELPSRESIEEDARETYEWLEKSDQRGGRTAGREAAERLSNVLLGSVAQALAGMRLAVIADGFLHYLPFAALPAPGAGSDRPPLIAEHEIVTLPSASVLATLRRRASERPPAAGSLAVVADPVFGPDDPRLGTRPKATPGSTDPGEAKRDSGTTPAPERLAYSQHEAQAILDLVPPETRLQALGFDANRSSVLAGQLDSYRIVHFAVHGEIHEEQPEYSHLVLSLLDPQSRPLAGRLYMHEIDDLHLPADLVVLSACETALGKQVRGEGLMGMTRGFMDAGATRVLVSLWQVSDVATARLMERFYRELLVEGRTPAAALRAAQVWMLETRRWQAPYYWAGFSLQGEWR